PLSVRSGLQSRRVHGSDESDTSVGQLSLILEGEPSSVARRPQRSTRFGRNICVRLESAECQPQLHAAHGGAALPPAAPLWLSQHLIAWVFAERFLLSVPLPPPACLVD